MEKETPEQEDSTPEFAVIGACGDSKNSSLWSFLKS
jgi:hypothetical protein